MKYSEIIERIKNIIAIFILCVVTFGSAYILTVDVGIGIIIFIFSAILVIWSINRLL